ncbi:hypothetical protein PCL_06049 [Purpureocillium lilacinum]|nr:hypothetical protein PCL_06049 [Purpureocillium lilacinum]
MPHSPMTVPRGPWTTGRPPFRETCGTSKSGTLAREVRLKTEQHGAETNAPGVAINRHRLSRSPIGGDSTERPDFRIDTPSGSHMIRLVNHGSSQSAALQVCNSATVTRRRHDEGEPDVPACQPGLEEKAGFTLMLTILKRRRMGQHAVQARGSLAVPLARLTQARH